MFFEGNHNSITFAIQMVVVAQLVRASDCGSEGRGFEPHQSPIIVNLKSRLRSWLFVYTASL